MLLLRRMVTLLLKEFCNMSFLGISLAELLKSHAKAEEVTEFYKGRIRSHNEKLNVFLDVAEENPEESGELHGLPLALKANISTQKLTTNASSKVLDTYIAPFNSTVAQKLSTAGGSLLGKTNMDAWAHGSSTETSDYGTTRNPYNIEYVPGGSSGAVSYTHLDVYKRQGHHLSCNVRNNKCLANFNGISIFNPVCINNCFGVIHRSKLISSNA